MAFNPEMRQSFNNEADAIRKFVTDAFYSCPHHEAINHDWLERVVARYYREKDKKPKL